MQHIQKILSSRIIFILFCVIVLFGLFGFNTGSIESRLVKVVWNMNHLIVFYIGNLFLFNFFPIIRPNKIFNIVLILTAMLVISGGIEFVQKHIGRTPSYGDIALNMAGSLLAISSYIFINKPFLLKRNALTWVLIVVAAVLIWPNIRYMIAEYNVYRQFPTLADFSKPFALSTWRAVTTKISITSKEELEVTFLPESNYSRLVFDSFYGRWDKFHDLVVQIENPNTNNFEILLRIHDKQHKNNNYLTEDRFSRYIELEPGKNTIVIPVDVIYRAPKSRHMDLEKLEELMFIMPDLEQPHTILIKKFYLR